MVTLQPLYARDGPSGLTEHALFLPKRCNTRLMPPVGPIAETHALQTAVTTVPHIKGPRTDRTTDTGPTGLKRAAKAPCQRRNPAA